MPRFGAGEGGEGFLRSGAMNPRTEASSVRYHHTQFGWPSALAALGVVGVVMLAAATGGIGALPPILPVILAIVLTALTVFSRMDTVVTAEHLRVSFLPGWPRRTIPLSRIQSVRRVRTSWLWGWGIRLTHRGWLWNVSGLEGVELALEGGGRLRVGTDDVDGLLAALNEAGAREEDSGLATPG